MRKYAFVIAAGLALTLGGYAPSAISADFKLTDGTYSARFPDGCGKMVIKSGGQSIKYSYGPCGGSPTFNSSGRFNGKVIKISAATYTLSSVSSSSMKGNWKLGSYSATVTFKK